MHLGVSVYMSIDFLVINPFKKDCKAFFFCRDLYPDVTHEIERFLKHNGWKSKTASVLIHCETIV